MKTLDVIRLIVLSAPLGLFVTYAFFLAITYTLKVKPVDAMIRRLMTIYSLLVAFSGLMIPSFYYLPDIFYQFNIVYFGLVAFSMVVFYHFQYLATRSDKRFSKIHYILPAVICAGLFVFREIRSDIWETKGDDISLITALVFGTVYTIKPLSAKTFSRIGKRIRR